MRNLLAGLLVILVTGCTSVAPEIRDSIRILKENTEVLGANYVELLERSQPPKGTKAATWAAHVRHQKSLVRANTRLSEVVSQWADVEAKKEEVR